MLAKRLKVARRSANLTQEELANRVKTTKATISNYENEHSTPSNEMLVLLAKALNTTTDHLLGHDITKHIIESDVEIYDMEDVTAEFSTEYYKEKIQVSVSKSGTVEIVIENEDVVLGSGTLEKLQAYELAIFILKNL